MKYGVAHVLCSCTNEFQDKKYGIGVRVANATKAQDDKQVVVRCTVCSKEHRVDISKVK